MVAVRRIKALTPEHPATATRQRVAPETVQSITADPDSLDYSDGAWLAISLPRLEAETLACPNQRMPLVVTVKRGKQTTITSCNTMAARLGVEGGMPLGTALAIHGGLIIRDHDAHCVHRALQRLAAWCGQFTSRTSISFPSGLMLEVGGSRRLFGGFNALTGKISAGLDKLGFSHSLGLAPTPRSAEVFTRGHEGLRCADHTTLRSSLASLPVGYLASQEKSRRKLSGMGVNTLGELLRLPHADLARRFGRELVQDMDKLLGQTADPRQAYRAPPSYTGRICMPVPDCNLEHIARACQRLVLELGGSLRACCCGVTDFQLTVHHDSLPATTLVFHLSTPANDPEHLTRVIRERLERTVLPAAVEEVALKTAAFMAIEARSEDWLSPAKGDDANPGQLLDKLTARLGSAQIFGVCLHPEHRPEKSWRWCSPGTAGPSHGFNRRPLWLFERPVKLGISGGKPVFKRQLELSAECERISSGWWDGEPVRRDYHVALTANGVRLWIYRELGSDNEWYLHGIFE